MDRLPISHDVIEYLENYNLDTLSEKSSESFTVDEETDLLTVINSYSKSDMVKLSNTGGVLPTPLLSDTIYYVIIGVSGIKLATSWDNSEGGVAIDITGSGTGTHTIKKYDYTQVSSKWLNKRISNTIIPFVSHFTSIAFNGTEQVTEYYSGTRNGVILLNRKSLVSIDEITVVNPLTNLTLSTDLFDVSLSEGILTPKIRLLVPIGNRNLKITYTHGFNDVPDPLFEAIVCLAAEKTLGHVASRTGGGTNLGTQGINKSFGEIGKWTEERNDLTAQAYSLLDAYSTGVIG